MEKILDELVIGILEIMKPFVVRIILYGSVARVSIPRFRSHLNSKGNPLLRATS